MAIHCPVFLGDVDNSSTFLQKRWNLIELSCALRYWDQWFQVLSATKSVAHAVCWLPRLCFENPKLRVCTVIVDDETRKLINRLSGTVRRTRPTKADRLLSIHDRVKPKTWKTELSACPGRWARSWTVKVT